MAEIRNGGLPRPLGLSGLPDFTTYLAAEVPVDQLERAFASVERTVLNQVRTVSATNRGPDLHGAVADLSAIHLVRSPSFRDFRVVQEGFRRDGANELAAEPRLPEVFERHVGRPPVAGELLDTAETQLDRYLEEPSLLAESMARQHNQIAERLSRFHLQVVEIAVGLPGLVLADTPIVHADLGSGRYGFRDRLALLEASLIIGPLTRSVAACFSATRLPPATLRTHKALDALNALFIREQPRRWPATPTTPCDSSRSPGGSIAYRRTFSSNSAGPNAGRASARIPAGRVECVLELRAGCARPVRVLVGGPDGSLEFAGDGEIGDSQRAPALCVPHYDPAPNRSCKESD